MRRLRVSQGRTCPAPTSSGSAEVGEHDTLRAMIALLMLAVPALAFDVELHVAPKEGASPWVTFHDVVVGVEHVVTVPCARAPTCRLSVVVSPQGEEFRVAVHVSEVRRHWLGGERTVLVGAPNFVVPVDQLAEFFIGDEIPLAGTNPVVVTEEGLHIQARVRIGDPA